jgi:arylformamidase
MPVYEGDPGVEVQRVASLSEGDICNLSKMTLGLHTGTHVDAPSHFIEGAPAVDQTPLAALVGPAYVADATSFEEDIRSSHLKAIVPAETERLLIKTRNSALWDRPSFDTHFVGLAADAARHLVDRGVSLVGVDYLSVAPPADPAPTHIELLRAGVVILEGLDLRGVEPGAYTLICLPILVQGADGAPARALLVRD